MRTLLPMILTLAAIGCTDVHNHLPAEPEKDGGTTIIVNNNFPSTPTSETTNIPDAGFTQLPDSEVPPAPPSNPNDSPPPAEELDSKNPRIEHIGEGLCRLTFDYVIRDGYTVTDEQPEGDILETGTSVIEIPCCTSDYECQDSSAGKFCSPDPFLAEQLGPDAFISTCQPCLQGEVVDSDDIGCGEGEICTWGLQEALPEGEMDRLWSEYPRGGFMGVPERNHFQCEREEDVPGHLDPNGDEDDDGSLNQYDCDPRNPNRGYGVWEVCDDGMDNDCDGRVDYNDFVECPQRVACVADSDCSILPPDTCQVQPGFPDTHVDYYRGRCEIGQCVYDMQLIDCNHGCAGGQCLPAQNGCQTSEECHEGYTCWQGDCIPN